jgi:hypothetical protein
VKLTLKKKFCPLLSGRDAPGWKEKLVRLKHSGQAINNSPLGKAQSGNKR